MVSLSAAFAEIVSLQMAEGTCNVPFHSLLVIHRLVALTAPSHTILLKGATKIGYLSEAEVAERLRVKEKLAFNAGKFKIDYSVVMQRGYYREFIWSVLAAYATHPSELLSLFHVASDLDKPCQDSFLERNVEGVLWLCVFDGHGSTGHDVSFSRRTET